jgi:hypothetical protein
MAAQLHLQTGDRAGAIPWLQSGMQLATSTGDQKTLSELQSALEEAEEQ